MTVADVARALGGFTYRVGREDELQAGIAAALTQRGIVHERERHLGRAGRVDFYLSEDRIGIEAKTAGSLAVVARQLIGYMEHADIAGLVLVTRRLAAAPERDEILGKPFAVVYVGAGRAF